MNQVKTNEFTWLSQVFTVRPNGMKFLLLGRMNDIC